MQLMWCRTGIDDGSQVQSDLGSTRGARTYKNTNLRAGDAATSEALPIEFEDTAHKLEDEFVNAPNAPNLLLGDGS